MMERFSQPYANVYDLLYNAKDYVSEIERIESIARSYHQPLSPILDYGCGTGNHLQVLAAKSDNAVGVDQNRNMLAIAKQKLNDFPNVRLIPVEERATIDTNSINLCLSLFDVLSYMTTNDELNDFLGFVHRVLGRGGIFIFDFWYGPAVNYLNPEKRWKEFENHEHRLLRLTTPVHDRDNCFVDVTHDVILFKENQIHLRFSEVHRMRYFYKPELYLLLNYHGFEILHFGTWENLNKEPTIENWSGLMVCRKI